jgi:hypothetical protein
MKTPLPLRAAFLSGQNMRRKPPVLLDLSPYESFRLLFDTTFHGIGC